MKQEVIGVVALFVGILLAGCAATQGPSNPLELLNHTTDRVSVPPIFMGDVVQFLLWMAAGVGGLMVLWAIWRRFFR